MSRTTQTEAPPLPHSADAERAILGAIILNDDTLMAAAEKLDVSDFFLPVHRRMFSAMKRLAIAETAVDFVTLLDEMGRQGELADGEERAYVMAITDGLPRVTNVDHYVAIVKDKSARRQLIALAEDLRDKSLSGREPTTDVLEAARRQLGGVDVLTNGAQVFDDFNHFREAPPMSFAIEGFLENNAATAIAGLSGHGKTFVMLSVARALLAGPPTKLWNLFPVSERAERVIYLIPECTLPPFKHRLELLRILDHVRTGKLLTRTLNRGPAPDLVDPRILHAAKGAHIFLDTIVRFIGEGDENSASDNQRGIASDIFALLEAGARSVVFAAHSSKSFAKESTPTLENVMRGTGDLGAMIATCWAVRQIDAQQNILHVTNVKPRDLEEAPQPFQLRGRPAINETGDFELWSAPGESGPLSSYVDAAQNKGGGAPGVVREAKAANIALMRSWLVHSPNLSSPEIVAKFRAEGIDVKDSTVRNYRRQLDKESSL